MASEAANAWGRLFEGDATVPLVSDQVEALVRYGEIVAADASGEHRVRLLLVVD